MLTEAAPDVAVGWVDFQDGAQVFHSRRESVLGAQNTSNTLHSWHRPLIELQGLFVALHGTIEVLHLLRERAYRLSEVERDCNVE